MSMPLHFFVHLNGQQNKLFQSIMVEEWHKDVVILVSQWYIIQSTVYVPTFCLQGSRGPPGQEGVAGLDGEEVD